MPASIEFLVWLEKEKRHFVNPIMFALMCGIFQGGNAGHAAIKITIPQNEIDNNLIQTLKSHAISIFNVQTNFSENIKPNDDKNIVTKSCYEIYFSFWAPEDGVKRNNQLGSVIYDMYGEQLGRELAKTDKIFFEPQIEKEMLSTRRGNIFHLFRRRKVFSGPYNILSHTEEIKNILLILRELLIEKDRNIANEFEKLSGINKKTLNDHNQLNFLRQESQKISDTIVYVDAFLQGTWSFKGDESEKLLLLFSVLEDKVTQLKNKESLADSEKQFLDLLQKGSTIIKNYWVVGIHPDFTILYPSKNNFNVKNMLLGMLELSNKKYQMTGWNCCSTALYVLLQGIPDQLKIYFQEHIRKLKINKQHIPLYTPHQAMLIATKLQNLMLNNSNVIKQKKLPKRKLIKTSSSFFKQKNKDIELVEMKIMPQSCSETKEFVYYLCTLSKSYINELKLNFSVENYQAFEQTYFYLMRGQEILKNFELENYMKEQINEITLAANAMAQLYNIRKPQIG